MLWNVEQRLRHNIPWAIVVLSHKVANFIACSDISNDMVDRIYSLYVGSFVVLLCALRRGFTGCFPWRAGLVCGAQMHTEVTGSVGME